MKKTLKILAVLAVALVVLGAVATPARAAWKSNSRGWWWTENSAKGYATGWRKIDGKWYWFDARGYMVTGWKQVDGKWYYFNPGGSMETGWLKDGGRWYYLNSGGLMATGWKQVDGKWYFLEKTGAMAKSRWEGNYYLTQNGSMLKSAWTYDGYEVDANGKWTGRSMHGRNTTVRAYDGKSQKYVTRTVPHDTWRRFTGRVRVVDGYTFADMQGINLAMSELLRESMADTTYTFLELGSSQKIWCWNAYSATGGVELVSDCIILGDGWNNYNGKTVTVWAYPWDSEMPFTFNFPLAYALEPSYAGQKPETFDPVIAYR